MIDPSGKKDDPIEILEDEEQQNRQVQRIQFAINRQTLYKAHMSSQFDVLLAVIKVQMNEPEEKKDQVLKNRIMKFFSSKVKTINLETQNLRQRREPDYNSSEVQPVPNELILFGVDFLSTKQIKNKFPELEVLIKWLDDSHCRVVFKDADSAKKGLLMNLRQQEESSVKIQNEQEIPRCWFQLQPYNYLTFQRRLYCRHAANNEDERQIEKSNDYYMFQQARKQYEEAVRNEVTSERYFRTMLKYGLVNERKVRQKMHTYENRRQGHDSGFRRNREFADNRTRGDGNFRTEGGRFNRDFRNNNRGEFRGEDGPRNRCYDNENNREDNYERSRNKKKNNYELPDNFSIVSYNSKKSDRPRKQREQSMSICSREDVRDRDADVESNYSFILNASEVSEKLQKRMMNLSIGGNEEAMSPIRHKQDEVNLSFASEMEQPKKKRDLNLSIEDRPDESQLMKKKKKDANLSFSRVEHDEQPSSPKKNRQCEISMIVLND